MKASIEMWKIVYARLSCILLKAITTACFSSNSEHLKSSLAADRLIVSDALSISSRPLWFQRRDFIGDDEPDAIVTNN